jgi:tetratricopeptide (TPR) repeat protein
LPVLDGALQRAPDDLPVAEARAYALGLQGRSAEAMAAFKAILGKAPERERALLGAASTAERLEQTETALDYWRRTVVVNPWFPDYRRSLTLLLIKKEAWAEAQTQADAWLRLDPLSVEARTGRILCLLGAGNKDEARAEFQRIEAMAPSNLNELRIRFERKLK